MPKHLVYNATLVHRQDLSDVLGIFRIRPDETGDGSAAAQPGALAFTAGQYAVLGANNEEEPEKGTIRRAYSIASPPYERRWQEYYVRYVDQPTSPNPFTHLLWKMQPGARLWLGPKITGRFTLRDTLPEGDTRLKIFVAAGTGVAPFVAMVLQAARDGEFVEGIAPDYVVLHGVSHPQDLGYKVELEDVLNRDEQRYFPTVSRPHLHPDWDGDTGRVENFFLDENLVNLDRRLGLEPGRINPHRCVVYVCGLQGTIAQSIIRLLRRGFVPNDRRIREALRLPADLAPSLFFEQYDTSPILELDNEPLMASLRASLPTGL